MNKLLITALFAHTALYSQIDEQRLVIHLHNLIDQRSHQITHSSNSDCIDLAYNLGHYTALSKLCHEIESGKFETEVTAPKYPESPKGMNGNEN